MITIGLTGASGSGKSYIAKLFSMYQIPTVNADHIVHTLYQTENECTAKLKERFGDAVINTDHSVNRRILCSIVFQDKEKLTLLNQTVHPFVICEIQKEIEKARQNAVKAILIDAPHLFEAGLDRACNVIISVIADKNTRIQRIAARDHIGEQDAAQRLSHQYGDDFFKQHSDFCIYNSDCDNASEQIHTILTTLGLI